MKAEEKLRKTASIPRRMRSELSILTFSQGSKIRSTYIAFAQKEKKRLEQEISESEQEIATREKEVARLRGVCADIRVSSRSLTGSHHVRHCRADGVPLRGSTGGEETIAYVVC